MAPVAHQLAAESSLLEKARSHDSCCGDTFPTCPTESSLLEKARSHERNSCATGCGELASEIAALADNDGVKIQPAGQSP